MLRRRTVQPNNRLITIEPSRSEKIQRGDLDGADIEDLVTTGLYGPWGIALDLRPDTNIPAVSEWGMVAMTVLMLTTGTLVLMRRRALEPLAGKRLPKKWRTLRRLMLRVSSAPKYGQISENWPPIWLSGILDSPHGQAVY